VVPWGSSDAVHKAGVVYGGFVTLGCKLGLSLSHWHQRRTGRELPRAAPSAGTLN